MQAFGFIFSLFGCHLVYFKWDSWHQKCNTQLPWLLWTTYANIFCSSVTCEWFFFLSHPKHLWARENHWNVFYFLVIVVMAIFHFTIFYRKLSTKIFLTLILQNKLSLPHPFLTVNQSDNSSVVCSYKVTNWLDLHCLQRQCLPGPAGQGLIKSKHLKM